MPHLHNGKWADLSSSLREAKLCTHFSAEFCLIREGRDSWAPKPTYAKNFVSVQNSSALFWKGWTMQNCNMCQEKLLKYPLLCGVRPPLISRLRDTSPFPPLSVPLSLICNYLFESLSGFWWQKQLKVFCKGPDPWHLIRTKFWMKSTKLHIRDFIQTSLARSKSTTVTDSESVAVTVNRGGTDWL